MYTDDALKTLAAEWAQGLNREQYADIRSGEPRDGIVNIHELLKAISGDVLAAYGTDALAGLTGIFLREAGIPFVKGEPTFKSLVFEFAEALDRETVQPGHRRLFQREAVPPPDIPERPAAPSEAPKGLTVGQVVRRYVQVQEKAPTQYTRKVVRCLGLFETLVGTDLPVGSLRQRHVTDFLRDICGLPVDWATRADRGVATVREMLARGLQDGDKEMSPTTYKDNYRAPLKAFLSDSRRDHGDEGSPI